MSRRQSRVHRLEGVPGIAVDRMGAAADEAAARFPDLLRMENLDTDVRPPDVALEATRSAVDEDAANSYLPFVGQEALRRAASAHVSRLAGVEVDWRRQCLVTAGGLNGCLVTLLALLDTGDEVVLTDPTYVGLTNRVRIAGGVPVRVPYLWTDSGWRLDLDALRKAVTPRTQALLLMSPSMPSGAVLSRAEWQAVAEVCRDADLWLVYDAAMERILYDGRPYLHPASLPGMAERTITVGSASKELRMIGWRVGWVVAPEPVLADIALVGISDVVVPVGVAQAAVAAALSSPAAEADVASAVAEWQRRRDVVAEELAGLPLRSAAGGWSSLLDVGETGFTAEQASALLMERGHVAATPMTSWGVRNGPGLVRLVFSNEPVERLRGLGSRVRRALG
jgi:aspartate/methionine/tyrosine aminotransferase